MAKDSVNPPAAARPAAELRRNSRNTLWYGLLGGSLLLGAVVAVILVTSGGSSGAEITATKDLAPDFSFTLYQGQPTLGAQSLDISDLQGKPVVVNFWAGLCPPCRAELPELQEFYEDFKDQVTLVGVDIGQFTGLGNQQDARDLLSELGITYPNGFTDEGGVVPQYRIVSMPTTIFINSRGEVFRRWSGALNQEVLTEVVEEMLSQES